MKGINSTPPDDWNILKPSLSIISLVTVNLVPLAGVLMLGWDASAIVLLYWAENLAIGFYNTLKISLVKVPNPPIGHLGKLFAIPFFWLHFGSFCGMHGLFILALFKIGDDFASIFPVELWPGPLAFVHLLVNSFFIVWKHHPPGIGWPVLCLFASHGISFVQNYLGQKEYLVITIPKLMNQPYKRIFIMHIAVIAGGWIIMLFNAPTLFLCIFVLFKISLDINMHTREHSTPPEQERTT